MAFPDAPYTSREGFLRAHGITRDKPDAPCWSSLLGSGYVVCECHRSFEVTTPTGIMDVLVCSRGMDPPASAEFLDMGSRTVLYGALRGAPKLLLDVPTDVTVNPENAEPGGIVGKVGLRAMPSPNGVTLVDEWENDEGPWCPQAVKRASAQRGHDWPLVHRRYAAVCATGGRYVLKDGRLVKGGAVGTSGSAGAPPSTHSVAGTDASPAVGDGETSPSVAAARALLRLHVTVLTVAGRVRSEPCICRDASPSLPSRSSRADVRARSRA